MVLIIGILAAVALPQYNKAVWRSRYAALKLAAENLVKNHELYYLENGHYLTNYSNDKLVLIQPDSPGIVCTNISIPPERIECWFKDKGQQFVTYEARFAHVSTPNRRTCYAYNQDLNHITNKICQAETGLAKPSREHTILGWYAWDYK